MEEVKLLLAAYGLSHLAQACDEHGYTKAALLAMKPEDFPDLSKKKGDHVLLRKLLEEQNTTGISSVTRTQSGQCEPSTSTRQLSQERSNEHTAAAASASITRIATTSGLQASLSSLRAAKRPSASGDVLPSAGRKVAKFEIIRAIEDLDLENLISKDTQGGPEILLYFCDAWSKYEEELANDGDLDIPYLNDAQKNRIAVIIANYLMSLDDFPDHKLFPKICEKLLAIFHTEGEGTWYKAPGTATSHADGKIPTAIRNIKQRRRLLGLSGPSKRTKNQTPVPARCSFAVLQQPETDEVKSAIAWLNHSRSPWPMVLEKWSTSAPTRFRILFQSEDNFSNSYIEKFPVLGHKSGHELILQDFNLLYPNAKSLFVKWDFFVKKTTAYGKLKIKKKENRDILNLLNNPNIDQDGVASVILDILPCLKANHQTKINDEPVKIHIPDARDSYLVRVNTVNDIKRAVSNRREKLKNRDGGGQPLIVLVGSAKDVVTSAHVSVADLRFDCDTVVQALDIFFKTFQSLHICYPSEAQHIWKVIQLGVYEIETQWDGECRANLSDWLHIYKS